MSDTNLVLVLKNGTKMEVIYPLRVFTEYETPWLDEPGCLQTSDVLSDLAKFKAKKDFSYGGRFVIGTWMPQYDNSTNRVNTIPMNQVENILPASEEATNRGNKARWEENEKRLDESYPDDVINRRILAQIFPDLAEKILTRFFYLGFLGIAVMLGGCFVGRKA